MIPVWVIALVAVLGAVCLALPLHIGMTGICLLLLAAVLLALRPAYRRRTQRHRPSKSCGGTFYSLSCESPLFP